MIYGLTLGNEGSVRDWLRHGSLNVTQGKNFDRSGSLGPWIVPADELDPGIAAAPDDAGQWRVRQDDRTERLTWNFAWLICYITQFATLKPGDLIFTGTPVGAGGHQTPPQWLKHGDVVEVEVPEIGVLRNTVVSEHKIVLPSPFAGEARKRVTRASGEGESGMEQWEICSSVSPARSMTACSRFTPAK